MCAMHDEDQVLLLQDIHMDTTIHGRKSQQSMCVELLKTYYVIISLNVCMYIIYLFVCLVIHLNVYNAPTKVSIYIYNQVN